MSTIKHKSTESIEDYLETILILSEKKAVVRSIDVATEMNFSKPSVSVAMKNLRSKEFIEIDADGYIKLTNTGKEVARNVYEKHLILSKMLMELGVSEKTALEDACRIEHDLSEESFEAIKNHIKL